MKPCNFPGRKNDRRKSALARMTPPRSDMPLHLYVETEYALLRQSIMSDAVARAIRTKKDRSARAKLRG